MASQKASSSFFGVTAEYRWLDLAWNGYSVFGSGKCHRCSQNKVHDYIEFNLLSSESPTNRADRYRLTARKREVLDLLSCGIPTGNDKCSISALPRVKTHLIHIYEKLGVETRWGRGLGPQALTSPSSLAACHRAVFRSDLVATD